MDIPLNVHIFIICVRNPNSDSISCRILILIGNADPYQLNLFQFDKL